MIRESYDKSKDHLRRLKVMRSVGNYDDYTQWSDLVDAAALPSLSMQMAVDSMQMVVKEADDIKKLGSVKTKLDLFQDVRLRSCKT